MDRDELIAKFVEALRRDVWSSRPAGPFLASRPDSHDHAHRSFSVMGWACHVSQMGEWRSNGQPPPFDQWRYHVEGEHNVFRYHIEGHPAVWLAPDPVWQAYGFDGPFANFVLQEDWLDDWAQPDGDDYTRVVIGRGLKTRSDGTKLEFPYYTSLEDLSRGTDGKKPDYKAISMLIEARPPGLIK